MYVVSGMSKGGMIDSNAAVEERAAELCPFMFQCSLPMQLRTPFTTAAEQQKELRDAILYNSSQFERQAVEKRRIYLVSSR